MTEVSKTPPACIGCDVGKSKIAVCDSRDGRTRLIRNTPEDLAALATRLDPGCLVICEATGGYELTLLAAMVLAGIPAHRADARKVKAFIRSFGTIGKTDSLDARALADYGRERHARLARWQAHERYRDELHALVMARQDMVKTRTAYANRRAAPGSEPAWRHLDKLIDALETEITAIEKQVQALIRAHEPLRAAVRALCSVTGVGVTTASALLALMPELGTLDRRRIAALGALAPHPNQSGDTERYRRTKGGRRDVRSVLFMAALSASQHHTTLSVFYQTLLARGKLPLVALTAVMRKLLIICNAVLKQAAGASQPAG